MKRKDTFRIVGPSSIDEKSFVYINGQEQYISIRGKNVENPIILNLHGGPANPDSFFTYEFAKEIIEDFTYVSWDQRGCGRTYYKNKSIDAENITADFEQAIKDVDTLVDYLCTRFNKDKVIIMGHSYGSLLGIHYVAAYPEKVESYIGIGQSVSLIDTQQENYNEIIDFVKNDKKKLEKITKAYHDLRNNLNLETLMAFQQLTMPCFMANTAGLKQKNQLELLFSSPDLGFNDVRWLLGMLSLKGHYSRNKKLIDYTLKANTYDAGVEFFIPMNFVSGEHDKSCSVDLLKKYYETIIAPSKSLLIMKACAHCPQYDKPKLLANEVRNLLRK